MSMVLTMTTAAIVAGLTLSEFSLAAIAAGLDEKEKERGLETIFTDKELMVKTFENMDCHIKAVSENEIIVETACGMLRYHRNESGQAFRLYMDRISDARGLIENIRSFEEDYGRNVQEYTFHHIKENLAEGMSIESESYEGEDLYLTLTLE